MGFTVLALSAARSAFQAFRVKGRSQGYGVFIENPVNRNGLQKFAEPAFFLECPAETIPIQAWKNFGKHPAAQPYAAPGHKKQREISADSSEDLGEHLHGFTGSGLSTEGGCRNLSRGAGLPACEECVDIYKTLTGQNPFAAYVSVIAAERFPKLRLPGVSRREVHVAAFGGKDMALLCYRGYAKSRTQGQNRGRAPEAVSCFQRFFAAAGKSGQRAGEGFQIVY